MLLIIKPNSPHPNVSTTNPLQLSVVQRRAGLSGGMSKDILKAEEVVAILRSVSRELLKVLKMNLET